MALRGSWQQQLGLCAAAVVCVFTVYQIYGGSGVVYDAYGDDNRQPNYIDPYVKKLQLQRELEGLYRDPSSLPKGLHPSVKVVKARPGTELHYKKCVPLPQSPRPGVKVCVYPKEQDIYVSSDLAEGRLFENDLVLQMAQALKADPTLQLVDLGANIGVYTMYGAALGRRVLAVEMLPANCAQIQASLWASGLQDNVTLVNNALFSDHRELTANFISDNVGATHLNVSKTDFKHFDMHVAKGQVTVSTVCLDDLLPLLVTTRVWIKMDIERTEGRALQCASRFFAAAHVAAVMMEWLARPAHDQRAITAFMARHGFLASLRADRLVPVNTLVDTVPGSNVFFIKLSTAFDHR